MVLRNCSRRLARANFSKLGWQPNVIWTIAFSLCLKFYAIAARKPDLIRGSLVVRVTCQSYQVNRLLYLLASACQRLWLVHANDAYGGSHMLGVSSSLTL